jgi:hypothetical protein
MNIFERVRMYILCFILVIINVIRDNYTKEFNKMKDKKSKQYIKNKKLSIKNNLKNIK